MNWIKHLILHTWLRIDSANYVCQECPRLSYLGPYGDGMEDYRVSPSEWCIALDKVRP
jgi:hypothetical protein